ncbi:MAG: protein TolQ [Pseudomonadota bacterium]
MNADMSFITLITNASLVVQLVMLILLIASILSWTIMFGKWRITERYRNEANEFEDKFWSGKDLSTLYKDVTSHEENSGMAAIFESGFKEFMRQRNQPGIEPDVMLEATQRAMKVTRAREIDGLESQLPFLATVASSSPYIGLFGTVWGIMNSFRALGNVNNATLAMVAPGIAEALIATAMGLFAAIPAVIAYNRYINQVDLMSSRYDNFMDEFYSVLHRQAYANHGKQ